MFVPLVTKRHTTLRFLFLLLMSIMVSGCTSAQQLSNDPRDPWEKFNRGVYGFNDALDQAFLTPAATGYRAMAPEFVETGVSNFFANINDIGVALNNALQFKFLDAASDMGRVLVNSTVGLLGFVDVASHTGLQKHDEDFGQTLGHWGVSSGPYVMLPFFGPSSLRDTPGKAVDVVLWPLNQADIKTSERNGFFALNTVSKRAELMQLEEKTEELIRDRYVFIRDAYLARRDFLVNDSEVSVDVDFYEKLEDE